MKPWTKSMFCSNHDPKIHGNRSGKKIMLWYSLWRKMHFISFFPFGRWEYSTLVNNVWCGLDRNEIRQVMSITEVIKVRVLLRINWERILLNVGQFLNPFKKVPWHQVYTATILISMSRSDFTISRSSSECKHRRWKRGKKNRNNFSRY